MKAKSLLFAAILAASLQFMPAPARAVEHPPIELIDITDEADELPDWAWDLQPLYDWLEEWEFDWSEVIEL